MCDWYLVQVDMTSNNLRNSVTVSPNTCFPHDTTIEKMLYAYVNLSIMLMTKYFRFESFVAQSLNFLSIIYFYFLKLWQ